MSHYESAYGTDWDTIDKDDAIERAYALGVAASLGEYHREEFEAIRETMDSSYDRSVVELAFEEGRNEGRELSEAGDDRESAIWAELVEGEMVSVDADDVPVGGRGGLPEALDRIEMLDRADLDGRDAVELPEFLQRD